MAYSSYILLLLLLVMQYDSSRTADTIPGCRDKCGNVSIPYPFGVGSKCSREGFEITCNETYNPPRPFWGKHSSESNVVFMDISLSQGQARVYKYLAWECYNATAVYKNSGKDYMNFIGTPFKFSDTRNKFTVVGCWTLAYISDQSGYASGCVATCKGATSATSGSCSGIGCCQTSIPNGLAYYEASFDAGFNHSNVYQFSPCSWAFLGDKDWYQFEASDVLDIKLYEKYSNGVPLVLDWVVGNQSCKEAMQNKTSSYACVSEHSECVDSSNGPGYICNCSTGYQGNPYISGGCHDINECDLPDTYPCYGICNNLDGKYSCSCPSGKRGDPYKGTCQDKFSLLLKLVTGISGGIILAFALSLCVLMARQERRIQQAKDNFFKQNGGTILFERMRSERGVSFKVFKEEELDKATNKFDKKLELGRGGHGTVYEGYLNGIGKVAIKRAKTIDESQKDEFVKELVILSQINHRNVVKILGCCLEVEVPMLVYEYIPNGTLSYHIHDMKDIHPVPLDARLRIAYESAEALAYLHSSASPPILHGDVKSTNILLDDNYVAKVADFGASMLVAMDDAQLAELVQGTQGYLDPEYLQTRKLTEKSDVYSFGVVLLELLTGKKAIYVERSGSKEVKSLALSFLSAVRENKVMGILDSQVRMEGDVELIQEFVGLIHRCLSVNGEERPKMKEVAEELQTIRKLRKANGPWASHANNPEETESLLGAESSEFSVAIEKSALYSLEKRVALHIEAGRYV